MKTLPMFTQESLHLKKNLKQISTIHLATPPKCSQSSDIIFTENVCLRLISSDDSGNVYFPKTNMSPENKWLEDEISCWSSPFLGDMFFFRGSKSRVFSTSMLFVWVCLSFWDSNVCLSCFLKDSNLAFWILASLIEDQHLSFRLGLRHWKKKNPPNICWTSIVSRSGFQFFLPLSWVETYLFEQKTESWDETSFFGSVFTRRIEGLSSTWGDSERRTHSTASSMDWNQYSPGMKSLGPWESSG